MGFGIQSPLIDASLQPIPFAPGYFASTDGHIIGKCGSVLAPYVRNGYAYVLIYTGKTRRKWRVNRVICETFNGPPPTSLHQAAHNDGDKSNNAPSNLRWATCKENFYDRFDHGTWPAGTKNGQAKLTEDQVKIIKFEYSIALTPKGPVRRGKRQELAHRFGVSVSLIRNIIAGNGWKHVGLTP